MTSREVKNQKNCTLSNREINFIKNNYKKIQNKDIYNQLKITKAVFYQNLRLLYPKVKEEEYFKY
jgi:hypothetical protein